MFFNKSNKDEIVDEVLSNDAFTNLKLDLIDIDLKLETGDKFEVHYEGPFDEKPTVEAKADTLKIKEPRVDRKHGKFWKKGFIEVNIMNQNDSGNLVITVPKNCQLGTVNASLVSGDTTIKNLKATALSGFTVSGDVNFESVKADEFKLTTTSGDIDLDKVEVKQGKAKLTSGDFTIKNSQVFDEFKVSTTSGDNIVENVKVAQYQLSTLSGDNSLFGKNGASAKVGNDSDNSNFILNTLSGDNTVR